MSDRRVTVGVAGLGVGEQHARALAADPRVELKAIFDPDLSRAHAVAGRIGPSVNVVSSLDEILDDHGIDMVSIASPDDVHYEQVCRALDARKHVFVEKPLCQSLDQAADIKRRWAAHRGRVKLASNLVLRAAPLYRWLRDEIRRGAFGTIYAIDGDYLYGRVHKITEGWRKDVPDYSVMEGGGIHLIDLILWLTGERASHVFTVGNQIATRDTAFRYSDFMAATFNLSGGAVARITANFGCVQPHQHVLRVFGTQGTFTFDDAGARVHTSRDPQVPSAPVALAPLPISKGDLLPAFIDAVVNDADVSADTQEVFDGLAMAVASDRAFRTGQLTPVIYL